MIGSGNNKKIISERKIWRWPNNPLPRFAVIPLSHKVLICGAVVDVTIPC